eukprot:UN10363
MGENGGLEEAEAGRVRDAVEVFLGIGKEKQNSWKKQFSARPGSKDGFGDIADLISSNARPIKHKRRWKPYHSAPSHTRYKNSLLFALLIRYLTRMMKNRVLPSLGRRPLKMEKSTPKQKGLTDKT